MRDWPSYYVMAILYTGLGGGRNCCVRGCNGRFETSVSRVKSVTLKLSFKYLSGLVEQHTGLSSQNNKRRGAPERASGPLYGKEGLAAGLHPPEELD